MHRGDDLPVLGLPADAGTDDILAHLVQLNTQRAAEEKAQGEAINTFKNRAQQLAKAFGFGSYSIREVSINGNEYGGMQPAAAPRMKVMMASPMMEADSAIPAEPGKTRVEVSVNGSIQMK